MGLRRNRAQGEGSQTGEEPVGGSIGFLIHNLGVDEVDNPPISEPLDEQTPDRCAEVQSADEIETIKGVTFLFAPKSRWFTSENIRAEATNLFTPFP